MRTGTVYTETLIHLAPPAFAPEVPYQVAIVSLDSGGKITARITGERVSIGDPVVEADPLRGAPVFQRSK